jgi:hypothetical protein
MIGTGCSIRQKLCSVRLWRWLVLLLMMLMLLLLLSRRYARFRSGVFALCLV